MDPRESNLIEEMNDIIEEALKKEAPKVKVGYGQELALKILDLAIRIERLGREQYVYLGTKVSNPKGREMFKYLTEEEAGHIKGLKKEYEALRTDGKWLLKEKVLPQEGTCRITMPKKKDVKASRDIFPEDADMKKNSTDLDVLKLAIETKKRAIKFYCTASAKLDDPYGKKMFSHLVDIENRHLSELEVQYEWMDQAGFWFDPSMMTD
ncbi:MAG: ferritin family protein [Candidatus Altiarchaeota archaeon]|nr:ferritin family protein [Candidatus Altiarchaeota archaeon]